jgi:hypothetical protein
MGSSDELDFHVDTGNTRDQRDARTEGTAHQLVAAPGAIGLEAGGEQQRLADLQNLLARIDLASYGYVRAERYGVVQGVGRVAVAALAAIAQAEQTREGLPASQVAQRDRPVVRRLDLEQLVRDAPLRALLDVRRLRLCRAEAQGSISVGGQLTRQHLQLEARRKAQVDLHALQSALSQLRLELLQRRAHAVHLGISAFGEDDVDADRGLLAFDANRVDGQVQEPPVRDAAYQWGHGLWRETELG